MGVTKKIIKQGNGVDKPKQGDNVTMEYTGNLYDESKASNDYKGKQYVHACQLCEDPMLTDWICTGLTLQSAAVTSRPRLV